MFVSGIAVNSLAPEGCASSFLIKGGYLEMTVYADQSLEDMWKAERHDKKARLQNGGASVPLSQNVYASFFTMQQYKDALRVVTKRRKYIQEHAPPEFVRGSGVPRPGATTLEGVIECMEMEQDSISCDEEMPVERLAGTGAPEFSMDDVNKFFVGHEAVREANQGSLAPTGAPQPVSSGEPQPVSSGEPQPALTMDELMAGAVEGLMGLPFVMPVAAGLEEQGVDKPQSTKPQSTKPQSTWSGGRRCAVKKDVLPEQQLRSINDALSFCGRHTGSRVRTGPRAQQAQTMNPATSSLRNVSMTRKRSIMTMGQQAEAPRYVDRKGKQLKSKNKEKEELAPVACVVKNSQLDTFYYSREDGKVTPWPGTKFVHPVLQRIVYVREGDGRFEEVDEYTLERTGVLVPDV